ncbi:MAG TPA: AAA family ATPase [Blastocatellia bacterium]
MSRHSRLEIDIPYLLDRIVAVGDGAETVEEKMRLARHIRSHSTETAEQFDRFLIEQITAWRASLDEAREHQQQLEAMFEKLTSPPWYPAVFLGLAPVGDSQAAMVAQGGAWSVVRIGDEVDPLSLQLGDEVLLNGERNVVIGKSARFHDAGEIASFDRYTSDGRMVIRHRDEEKVVWASGQLSRVELKQGDLVRWNHSVLVAFEKVERTQDSSLFVEEIPDITFDDIGGLSSQIKNLLRSLRLHIHHPEIARKYRLRQKRSVLLVGPPGTGKTMIAKALANWLKSRSRSNRVRFMNITPGSLRSMWYGESERQYREAFRIAREMGREEPEVPVVMFFDEVDSIGAVRGSSINNIDDRVMPALMAELDGLQDRGNVMVVAATNRRDTIDPALLRAGRLGDLVLEVPRPEAKAAREIFAKHLTGREIHARAGQSQQSARQEMIEAAVAKIYSPNSDNELATITFRDGNRRVVRASDLISGASIENIVEAGGNLSGEREVEEGTSGLYLSDLMAAIANEFESMAGALAPENCHAHLTRLPRSVGVVSVEPVQRKVIRPYLHLNAA